MCLVCPSPWHVWGQAKIEEAEDARASALEEAEKLRSVSGSEVGCVRVAGHFQERVLGHVVRWRNRVVDGRFALSVAWADLCHCLADGVGCDSPTFQGLGGIESTGQARGRHAPGLRSARQVRRPIETAGSSPSP